MTKDTIIIDYDGPHLMNARIAKRLGIKEGDTVTEEQFAKYSALNRQRCATILRIFLTPKEALLN